jgi:polysaccharide biosynthesis/export protein VpsN
MVFYRLFALILLFFSASVGAVAAAEGDSKYRLGSGDVIDITVFGEDELTFQGIRLTDAGTVSYPFVGEIRAAGKTVAELEKIVRNGLLGDYLIDPKISVRVTEYREFYVNGEVKSPGGYPFQPGLTVRKAVALAGGFTEWAAKNSIVVIREDDPERKPTKMKLDSNIMPGDIITIDQSLF